MLSLLLMSFWFCVYILAFYLLLKIKKSVHIVSFVVVAYAILAYFSFVITVYAIIFQILTLTIMIMFAIKVIYLDRGNIVYLGVAPFCFGLFVLLVLSDFSSKYDRMQIFTDKSLNANNELIQKAIFSKLDDQEKDYLLKAYIGRERVLATQSLGGARCLKDINSFACDGWIASFVSWIKFKAKYQIGSSSFLENQEKEREIFKERYKLN